MSWKRSLSVVVLTGLTTLPILGALCITRCHPSNTGTKVSHSSAHHHNGAQHVHMPDRTSTRLLGTSAHDCGSHDLALSQASTAPERTESGTSSHPGAEPPTIAPRVLRV